MRHRLAGTALTLLASAANAGTLPVETTDLTIGFIKLTDMAPLAIAYEKHFFEDEGLYVRLEAQANWKVLLNRVISGFISSQTALETVMALPFRSIENGVTMCALVP